MLQSNELGSGGECQERAAGADGVDLSTVRTPMTWSLGCNWTKLKSQTSFHNNNGIRAVQGGNQIGVF